MSHIKGVSRENCPAIPAVSPEWADAALLSGSKITNLKS